jgi:lysozyme
MTFTDQARALLQRLEGCRLQAYVDQAGVWTIGYGHTGADVLPGLVWSQEQADLQLGQDLQRFISGVGKLVGYAAINDNQFSALVILAFNIGLASFAASSALRRVVIGALEDVPGAISMWNKIHDQRTGQLVVDAGLVYRRAAEVQLWNTPVGVT